MHKAYLLFLKTKRNTMRALDKSILDPQRLQEQSEEKNCRKLADKQMYLRGNNKRSA